jgi:5'/3'-nucleotidase SurE
VVNDDGPPCASRSPYILPLVNHLSAAGHDVCVVIPDRSRSWLGKAHVIESPLITATAFQPLDHLHEPWTIITGTPATCVHIGLYNICQNPDEIDLVISGPNHGRNATTIYNLSSGTVGGAMEAALCGKKGIALSFASKEPQRKETIDSACELSVKLIRLLHADWNPHVELYCINVPMLSDFGTPKIFYTAPQPCYWSKSSLFREIDIPLQGSTKINGASSVRHFEWAPELSDIRQGVEKSKPGTDAWAIREGHVR